MGAYNYHGRVERLRRSGMEVHEFGERTLAQVGTPPHQLPCPGWASPAAPPPPYQDPSAGPPCPCFQRVFFSSRRQCTHPIATNLLSMRHFSSSQLLCTAPPFLLHPLGAQGAYGDDVVELQAFLSGQGYFNSADGLSGYFGAVTKEALQNWQRDAGLRSTGVFNAECKWAYVRGQVSGGGGGGWQPWLAAVVGSRGWQAPASEAGEGGRKAVWERQLRRLRWGWWDELPWLPAAGWVRLPRICVAAKGRRTHASSGCLAFFAASAPTCAVTPLHLQEAKLAQARAAEQMASEAAQRPAPPLLVVAQRALPLASLGQLVLGTLVIGAASVGARYLWGPGKAAWAAVLAVVASRRSAVAPPLRSTRHAAVEAAAAIAAAPRGTPAGLAPPPRAPAAPLPLPGHGRQAAAAGGEQQEGGAAGQLRRLSEEEIQRRVAVMKGQASPKTPLPRPAPRPLPLGSRPQSDDPFLGSKYGTYYGGAEVLQKVKQFVEQESGGHAQTQGGSRRPVGVTMPRRPRAAAPRPAAPAAAAEASAEAALPAAIVPAVAEPQPVGDDLRSAIESFIDVWSGDEEEVEAAAAAVAGGPSETLLAGTELAAAPEPVVARRVPAVRPGRAAPLLPAEEGDTSPKPRPVAVVKPVRQVSCQVCVGGVGGGGSNHLLHRRLLCSPGGRRSCVQYRPAYPPPADPARLAASGSTTSSLSAWV